MPYHKSNSISYEYCHEPSFFIILLINYSFSNPEAQLILININNYH